jgi:hypothetical protein
VAVYVTDFYGLSFYGGSSFGSGGGGSPSVLSPTLGVRSCDIVQTGYGTLRIDVTTPIDKTYTDFRIVRNTFGFPYREDDGTVIYDEAGPVDDYLSISETTLEQGKYYYYGFFVKVSGTWYLAGACTGLTIQDSGYEDYFYNLIPRVYKAPMDELTDTSIDFENTELHKFTNVFALHLDLVRTEYDLLLSANDVAKVAFNRLVALGLQFGIQPEPSVAPKLHRLRVRTGSYLFRQRGTALSLRNAVNATLGWDVIVRDGRNRMLDVDQSSFANPGFEEWSYFKSYPEGAVVTYADILYVATVGSTGGLPPSGLVNWAVVDKESTNPYLGEWNKKRIYEKGSMVSYGDPVVYYRYINATAAKNKLPTNVTYWTVVTPDYLTYGNKDTGGFSTWEPLSEGYEMTMDDVNVLIGDTGPLTPTDSTRNLLRIQNTGGATYDIRLTSVARAAGGTERTRGDVSKYGIPLTGLPDWLEEGVYEFADKVSYLGRAYTSLADDNTTVPAGDTLSSQKWVEVPETEQYFTASLYSKAHNPAHWDYVQASITWFDQYGNELANTYSPTGVLLDQSLFDSFDSKHRRKLSDTDYGTALFPWDNSTEEWVISDGCAVVDLEAPALPATLRKALIDSTFVALPDAKIGVTFRSATTATEHGIIFRWTDDNNYWRASRTQLVKTVAGVETVVDTWTALVDNERLLVETNANNIIVSKYLPLDETTTPADEFLPYKLEELANVSDAAHNTATRHGIYEKA